MDVYISQPAVPVATSSSMTRRTAVKSLRESSILLRPIPFFFGAGLSGDDRAEGNTTETESNTGALPCLYILQDKRWPLHKMRDVTRVNSGSQES
jgi:hypothetical protein